MSYISSNLPASVWRYDSVLKHLTLGLVYSLPLTCFTLANDVATQAQEPGTETLIAEAETTRTNNVRNNTLKSEQLNPDASETANDASTNSQSSNDPLRQMQTEAIQNKFASWGHWGDQAKTYSAWTEHSNRLVPMYTFGMTLDSLREPGSVYANTTGLTECYGYLPDSTSCPCAGYYDQTDFYRLQQLAVAQGKKHIVVMIFDGMDWQTTRAAAVYRNKADVYDSGRGRGLAFQDYRGTTTDYAFMVSSPGRGEAKIDVDSQLVLSADEDSRGGFCPSLAGPMPWHERMSSYLLGGDRKHPHQVTDSAAAAAAMLSGIKTYNGSINCKVDGSQAVPIGRELQQQGFAIGAVSSVPVSHATPAAAYANNVSRKDYQDLSRDMLGLPSSAHRRSPLPGADVVIGCGWGEEISEPKRQGNNFLPGNEFLHESDLHQLEKRGDYVIAKRTSGQNGTKRLRDAAREAVRSNKRLLGFFGAQGGHLPFATADGNYDPTIDSYRIENYSSADLTENPTLADMTDAALQVLSAPTTTNELSSDTSKSTSKDSTGLKPFWLLVECGDVDWANHCNNIDNSIGAVFSGEEAFKTVVRWVETNDAWEDTVVLVASDHGYYFHLDDPQAIADAAARSKTITVSE